MSNIIAEIKHRYDVNSFVQRYITSDIQRKGRKNWIKCFSHSEHTASMIFDEKSFHCFGCGWHGDIIDAYAHIHSCNSNQAITQLARELGIESNEQIQIPATLNGLIRLEARLFRDYPRYFAAVMKPDEICDKDILPKLPAPDIHQADFTAKQIAKILKQKHKERVFTAKTMLLENDDPLAHIEQFEHYDDWPERVPAEIISKGLTEEYFLIRKYQDE